MKHLFLLLTFTLTTLSGITSNNISNSEGRNGTMFWKLAPYETKIIEYFSDTKTVQIGIRPSNFIRGKMHIKIYEPYNSNPQYVTIEAAGCQYESQKFNTTHDHITWKIKLTNQSNTTITCDVTNR